MSLDANIVEVQIGRPLRAAPEVVSRCHLGLPVVIEVPPLLDDGTPFPTLYWLTCPLATKRIGRLESGGGVRRLEQKAAADAQFGEALRAAHTEYEGARGERLPAGADPRPSGGVGGAAAGVKCLHAHYAHTRSGGANPVGDLVTGWIEPLDCTVPCVVGGARNPTWHPKP